MLLDVRCPSCGYTRQASDAVLGKTVLCPSCGGTFAVSRPAERVALAVPPLPSGRVEAAPPPRPVASAQPGEEPRSRTSAAWPAWVFAALGGAGALALVALIVLIGGFAGIVPGGRSGVGDRPAPPVAPVLAAPAPAPDQGAARSPAPTTAEVVARCEPSVALVRGRVSSGTGFLARPGVIVTNAHVIDDEFVPDLEILFPSAPEGQRGPFDAELLAEDHERDLAFLAVHTDLPPLELAPAYRFVKGADVLVIGNPGLGDEVVLENAISRGVMSSQTVIEGQHYFQMGIAINPGNSGGPVLDSSGLVVGVATLKSTRAESMGFGIPVEDLSAALDRLANRTDADRTSARSRHRAVAALRMLASAGALYALAIEERAWLPKRPAAPGANGDGSPGPGARDLDEAVSRFELRQLSRAERSLAELDADTSLSEKIRRDYADLASNYRAMRDLYGHRSARRLSAAVWAAQLMQLKPNHLRLIRAIQEELSIPVPDEVVATLQAAPPAFPQGNVMVQMVPGQGPPAMGAFRFATPAPPLPMSPSRGSSAIDAAREAQARARQRQRQMQQQLEDRIRDLRGRLAP